MTKHVFLAPLLVLFLGVLTAQSTIKITEDLELIKLTPDVYIHKSYATTETYGRFSCNGILYTRLGKGYLFDTPMDETQTAQLLDWIEDSLKIKLEGVIANHFHEDCVGGLAEAHSRGIPSYGTRLTQKLARADSVNVPQKTLRKKHILKLEDRKIICYYPGPAHTKDNIVTWFPAEKMLFGGCMLKSLKSGKGNLADAVIAQWSQTIRKVKETFPEIQIAVPGHGAYGNIELLDYTIEMFEEKDKQP